MCARELLTVSSCVLHHTPESLERDKSDTGPATGSTIATSLQHVQSQTTTTSASGQMSLFAPQTVFAFLRWGSSKARCASWVLGAREHGMHPWAASNWEASLIACWNRSLSVHRYVYLYIYVYTYIYICGASLSVYHPIIISLISPSLSQYIDIYIHTLSPFLFFWCQCRLGGCCRSFAFPLRPTIVITVSKKLGPLHCPQTIMHIDVFGPPDPLVWTNFFYKSIWAKRKFRW